MTQRSPFRHFRTSPEVIRLTVMLCVRYPLSLRNVENLQHERGHSKRSAPSPVGTISRPAAPPLSQSGVNSVLQNVERVWANRGWFALV
jgi:hypothetical protein